MPAVQRAAAQESPLPAVVKLFDGREYRGIVLEENDDRLLLRTWTGDKSFRRTEVMEVRRSLAAAERLAILRTLNPAADEAAVRRHDAEIERRRKEAAAARSQNGGAAKNSRQPATAPDHFRKIGAETSSTGVDIAPRNSRAKAEPEPATVSASGGRAAFYERMSRALDRRITIDIKEQDLVSTMALLSDLTGVTIIVDPKVRKRNPTATLRVKNMDAASVIRWLTRLTDTAAVVQDYAIYVSEKPAEEAKREEATSNRELVAKVIEELHKREPKVPDFPGPSIGLGGIEEHKEQQGGVGVGFGPMLAPGR